MLPRVALLAFLVLAILASSPAAARTPADPGGVPPVDPGGVVDLNATTSQSIDRTPPGIETVYRSTAIRRTGGGAGVDVAVLDSGVDGSHPDLARRVALCRDYTVSPVENGSCPDANGHGTHVAGVVLADGGPDGAGIYGVAPDADLYAFKACVDRGRCRAADVAAALRGAADAGAEIAVVSLGGDPEPVVRSAVDYATERGVLVIAAAGNGGPTPNTTRYPASSPDVVAVGAVERRSAAAPIEPESYAVPSFSARGIDLPAFEERAGALEVVAPGVDVRSTWPGGEYRLRSGTSMAAPHVAGLAAKLWPRVADADGDNRTNDDVRARLRERARGFDVERGTHARAGYDPAAGDGLPTVVPPRARIAAADTPTLGEPVTLRADGSVAPDSELVAYEWDVDDDGTIDARGRNVTHAFETPGTRTVRLRVRAADGTTAENRTTVRVNVRPTATFTYEPAVPNPAAPIRLDARDSTDPDGEIVSYEWDVDGDGVSETFGPTPAYAFRTPGEHTVTLRVVDADGATDRFERTIHVNAPPRPNFTVRPAVPESGRAVLLDASGSRDDDGTILAYRWDVDGDGAPDLRGERTRRTFDAVGPREVALDVTDDRGASATLTRAVLVNDRPRLSVDVPGSVPAGRTVTLRATVDDEVGNVTVTWRFSDGDVANGTTVSRSFASGTRRVTVIAADEYGASDRREVAVAVRSPTPVEETPTATPGFTALAALVALVLAALAARRRR